MCSMLQLQFAFLKFGVKRSVEKLGHNKENIKRSNKNCIRATA